MDTADRFNRASLLMGQSRYDMAEGELRMILVDDPDCSTTHALLAMCLGNLERFDEAIETAERAIHLDPDESASHYALASVYMDMDKFRKAEAALREAIALDPYDENNFSMLGSALFQQARYEEALEAADQGLAVDPEDVTSINIRAMALRQLGRNETASEAISEALAQDPENELSHFNRGWSYVEEGESEKALEHFREALRLDPDFNAAREGIVEALKSRNIIYRTILSGILWFAKQSTMTQWSVTIGILVVLYLLRQISDTVPALEPVVYPIAILFILACAVVWISSSLFNLMLRMSREGRLALTDDEISESNWVLVMVIPTCVCFMIELAMPFAGFLLIGLLFIGAIFLVKAVYECGAGSAPRKWMTAYSILLGLIGIVWVASFVYRPWMPPEMQALARKAYNPLLLTFVLGAVFSDDLAEWMSKTGSPFS